jgi:methylated-DNA-[protein]-cysteine S-methyltransferase
MQPTTFQKKVYEACSRIPAGKVTTYGRLAKEIGCGSARAVGQALRVNPFAPEVPCHRVVKADGSLGGFYGKTEGPELRRKEKLLREEGVKFDPDGRVAADSVVFLHAGVTRRERLH